MRSLRNAGVCALFAGLVALAIPATAAHAADGDTNGGAAPAVFVQTNDPAGNAILAYSRASDGTLSPAGSFATGGNGGVQAGAVVDPLASQGAVAYDRAHGLLFTVNAGSDSISTFTADGLALRLQQVVSSGGQFPTSIGLHGNLLYVLNAGGDGSVSGFRIAGSKLHPIVGSTRTLGLGNTNPPFFLDSPGQVGFTPEGNNLIVTTKRHGGTIDVWPVLANGRLGAGVQNVSPDAVPFAFDFDANGRLLVLSAASSALTSYDVAPDGHLSLVAGPVSDTQGAGCWIAGVPGGFFYIGNTASASLSTFHANGGITLVTPVIPTSAGPIDLVASPDGAFVYSEAGGAGTVDEFRVGPNGVLTPIGQITGLAAHVIEGIAAS
jgi:6-phosphogluconolactonase (cycloisomerase 2 family)